MFYLTDEAKIILYNKPVNLHKGFDSLNQIAKIELGLDLTPNTYVLFSNLRRDRIKVLFMDLNNISIMSMRFESTLNFKYDKVVVLNRHSFVVFLKNTISRERKGRFLTTTK